MFEYSYNIPNNTFVENGNVNENYNSFRENELASHHHQTISVEDVETISDLM